MCWWFFLATHPKVTVVGASGSIAFVSPVAGLFTAAYVTDKLLGLDVFPLT